MMHGGGKSDRGVVPAKLPNKTPRGAAEAREGRRRAEGNPIEQNAARTPSRSPARSALDRIRQAARRDGRQRFTALRHHVYDLDRLRAAYFALKRTAAARGRWTDREAGRGGAGGRPPRPLRPAAAAQSAPGLGRAGRRHPHAQGELGARGRYPCLLRYPRPRMAGEVCRAPHRGPAPRAPPYDLHLFSLEHHCRANAGPLTPRRVVWPGGGVPHFPLPDVPATTDWQWSRG